jgi:FkbH-like protein
MRITIYDKSKSDWTRALQLINKTNQFNMNGNQFSDGQILEIVNSGGHIYSVTLDDRSGSHGEILSFLVDKNSVVKSFVMSCRVLQREVEYFFLDWVLKNYKIDSFDYKCTGKNEMFKKSVVEVFFSHSEGRSTIDADVLSKHIKQRKDLMTIVVL